VTIDIHERMTERVTRARFEVEFKRSVRPLITLAIGAAVGLACWAVIAVNVGRGTFADTYELRVAVRDATAVTPGRNDVRIHGVKVGTVKDVERVDGTPTLTLQIESRYGRVFNDARAELRPNTALQDMYVDIVDRGRATAGVATALPVSSTRVGENVAQVLQTFEPDVRASLATLLDGFGGGLDGHGDDLRAAFVALAPTLDAAGDLTAELGARADLTRRLVSNLSDLTGELGSRRRTLQQLVQDGGISLRTAQAGAADLDATLRELPPTLERADSSLAAVRGVLGDTDDALRGLRPVADRLPAGLASVRALSADARPAVDALQRPVARLVPLSDQLRPLAGDLSDTMDALAPQTGEIDAISSSIADCTLAIYGFFQWTASITKYDDAKGVFPRGDAVLNTSSATGLAKDPLERPYRGCTPAVPKLAEP
jgi:phospholipid/cholesterol/gamma-HCH transport system substrate-binding protein